MDTSLGTIDIAKLRDEQDFDDSADELEEEERQRELKGILSKAFDDVSSIDDEDDENSSEFRSSEYRPIPQSLLHAKKKFTSTPNDNNNVVRGGRLNNDFSVIEEEPNSIHSAVSGNFGEKRASPSSPDPTSVERGREAEQNESYHIRLLLDQNHKLSADKTKLQHMYETVNGDFEGVSYKCQRLEEVLSEKDKLVDELMGKLNANQINFQTVKDALSAANNKLVIAESTISSLRNELKEMHQSDSVERIRSLYESQLAQLRDKYETDRSKWMDDRESLKEKIDDQKHQISKLKIELELRLKKNVPERKSNDSEQNCKKLEQDLGLTRESNRQLATKLTDLQSSIEEMRTKVSKLSQSLQSKEQEIEGLSIEVRNKEQLVEAKSVEVVKLNEQLAAMATSLKQLKARNSEEKKTSEKIHEDLRRELESQMEHRIVSQVEEYRNQVHECYQKEFTTRLQEIRDTNSKQQQQLESCVEKICSWIEGFTGQALKPQEDELVTVFNPIIKIWYAIEEKLDQQLSRLLVTKKEVEEAKKELEEAYIDSKSDPPPETDHPLLETVHQELSEAKEEIISLKEKVDKYKKNYTQQVKKFENEREQLKQDYAALVRNQVSVLCKDREEQLMNLLSRDSRQLLQQINQAYSDSLKHLKEQSDRYFEESSGRSLKKMGDAIITYHELVTKKITQRSQHLVRQVNQTFCEVDGGDGSFIRDQSITGH